MSGKASASCVCTETPFLSAAPRVRVGAQPVQAGTGVGDSRRDRLHDFVGYRGRQFPHRRDAIDMRELHLRLTQRFRSPHELTGPLFDTLLELLIESFELG